MNFWVHDSLVKNTTPPPGGGTKSVHASFVRAVAVAIDAPFAKSAHARFVLAVHQFSAIATPTSVDLADLSRQSREEKARERRGGSVKTGGIEEAEMAA